MRNLAQILTETISVKQEMLNDSALLEEIERIGIRMIAGYRNGGRVYSCGNGGSAADAQHLVAELTCRFNFDRPPLSAEALHTNTSHLTAVANDYDYESVFARALQASAREGDILFALSTSGNSRNVVQAAKLARDIGVTVVALTGELGGALGEYADFIVKVPSMDTGRIQEAHIVIIHSIIEHVEWDLFANHK